MPAFALVDCNNFFVSCERAFRPELEGRPVIVLSNNDGCVISRSEEAKALGIGMGAPFFEVRAIVVEHKVAVISANHELYVDFSRRVGAVLRRHSPQVQEYSIDESFLTMPEDATLPAKARSSAPRSAAGQASRCRSDWRRRRPWPSWRRTRPRRRAASCPCRTPTRARRCWPPPGRADLGHRQASAARLAAHGVSTAAEFIALRDALIEKTLGIGGLRLAQELRGVPCLPLVAARRGASRSQFPAPSAGRSAASRHWKRRWRPSRFKPRRRARRHGLKAGALSVFVGWREDDRAAGEDAAQRLAPTDDTTTLVRAAKALAGRLFVEGRAFRKAGVVLGAMESANSAQAEFFDDGKADRSRRLLGAVDRLNASLGAGTLRYGGESASEKSASRREWRSPRWTTQWSAARGTEVALEARSV